jgi:hypothetical protein
MNKAVLSWLCSSAALSFGLLTVHAAQAEVLAPAPQYEEALVTPANENNAVQINVPAPETNSAEPRAVNPRLIALDPNSDTVGDAAIDLSGCDCMGCRNTAIQILQTGRLILGQ